MIITTGLSSGNPPEGGPPFDTGIAGPGGSEHKPEGRVCFGIAQPFGTRTETVEFGAIGRRQVRAATVDHALQMLLDALRS